MTTNGIPKAILAHAKKHGMTVARDNRRDVGVYRFKGRDLISFNLSDARANKDELLKQIDLQLARVKR